MILKELLQEIAVAATNAARDEISIIREEHQSRVPKGMFLTLQLTPEDVVRVAVAAAITSSGCIATLVMAGHLENE